MRAIPAAALALFLLLVAGLPHAHADAGAHHDRHECVACSTASAEPGEPPVRSLAPRVVREERVVAAPASFRPVGAPLGAIPGQSPPAR